MNPPLDVILLGFAEIKEVKKDAKNALRDKGRVPWIKLDVIGLYVNRPFQAPSDHDMRFRVAGRNVTSRKDAGLLVGEWMYPRAYHANL